MIEVRVRGVSDMGHAPRIHHRPRVHRGKFSKRMWWSVCPCGHAKHFNTWRQAYVDAHVHSQELR